MGSTEENHDTEISVPEFSFDEWANELGLKRPITQELRKEELVTKEALSLVELKDLKELNFPLGVIKIIMNAISKWKIKTDTSAVVSMDKGPPPSEPAQGSPSGNLDQLTGAGKTLDNLLNDIEAPVVTKSDTKINFGFMDPRTILTLKAQSTKAVHITQFITEQCKRRRQNRRKEFIIKSGKDSEALILKPDDDHPYLGIYIEEWGAANMRLLNHLLSSGQLPRNDIEFYLAYTTKIFEFAEKYEWNSVLSYDYHYRELQAEHQFMWGTFSPHMEIQILVPKRGKPTVSSQASNSGQQPKEDCKLFKARGFCSFGTACKYRHPPTANKDRVDHRAENPPKNSLNTGQHA